MSTISLISIFGIVIYNCFVHWVADFVAQTHEQSIKKSTSNKYLVDHTGTYSLIWFVCSLCLSGLLFDTLEQKWAFSLYFSLITFILHTVTDYVTSRINSALWKENKVHDFFVSIGFDQFLHYVQIFGTQLFLYICLK